MKAVLEILRNALLVLLMAAFVFFLVLASGGLFGSVEFWGLTALTVIGVSVVVLRGIRTAQRG